MNRVVESELLDHLPASDAAAQRSRRDLHRINLLMGNAEILAGALQSALGHPQPCEILELGAGDGQLLLRVAEKLASRWPNVRVRLLDRTPVVTPETIRAFDSLGWSAESITADALEYLERNDSPADAVVANLFIHHFREDDLRRLFAHVASHVQLFVAVESRRSALPLLTSRLLWVIGCNAVTQHDAVQSVRAGFKNSELSQLWPTSDPWKLTERAAGLFSHLFVAQRPDS